MSSQRFTTDVFYPGIEHCTATAWAQLIPALEKQCERLDQATLAELYQHIVDVYFKPTGFAVDNGIVTFNGQYSANGANLALECAQQLKPWRKGPFRLGELTIDAEWRSDLKWNRIAPALPDLTGLTVADVGCNNGYYLYRIAAAGAARVTGFDPTLKYWLQHKFIAAHAPTLPIGFLPLGSQALEFFPNYYDVIFLMGINYHDAEPDRLLHTCRRALKPGGTLICESVTIPNTNNLEIFPAAKYAGIGGVFGIPTTAALCQQLSFAGFNDVNVQHEVRLTPDEQRATTFSTQKSLEDFLCNTNTTIEGYPPPHRAAIFAHRASAVIA